MVEKVVVAFLALTGLFFIVLYPDEVISLLQLFVDGAKKAAHALSNLNIGGKH